MKMLKLTLLLALFSFTISAFAQVQTVVFVHGAFADGSSWNKVIHMLQKKGIKVISVQNPLSSFGADVNATNRALDNATTDVLLVGHSWGGVVISEAGKHDKVKGLVYVAAFAPDAGQSANESGKNYPVSPGLKALKPDATGYASLTEQNLKENFAQDLKKDEQNVMIANQGPVMVANFDEKITTAAWTTKPSWYIVAANDRMIDPTLEAGMAKKMNSETTTLKSSHVPMLSKPKEVTEVIMNALKKLNAKK